eukprot:GHVT01076060.1.p1 GENE.GHVT01076060.1~~GHVT01076060.1.p1  ORF type:complete len:275 (+),score=58.94 GHVT01076060.1:245-1069(+)
MASRPPASGGDSPRTGAGGSSSGGPGAGPLGSAAAFTAADIRQLQLRSLRPGFAAHDENPLSCSSVTEVVSGVTWGWGFSRATPFAKPAPAAAAASGNSTNKPAQKAQTGHCLRSGWLYYWREILSGLIICFAQVPESVAFAFMAHVEPPVALHAAWLMGLSASILGGRPGMINGATGAFAAVIATFVAAPSSSRNIADVEMLFPTVLLAALWIIVFAFTRLGKLVQLISTPVMIGCKPPSFSAAAPQSQFPTRVTFPCFSFSFPSCFVQFATV